MKTNVLAKTVHSLHIHKNAKPLAVCISALFIFSMIAVFATTPVQGATATLALHTSGSSIVDSNGNVVYLRGLGIAGAAPNLVLWGQGGGDSWSSQWNYNPTSAMDQTFTAMRDQWHVNMIRVFIYPSWYYRDNIAPSQEDPNYAAQTTPISTRAYLRTLCEEAGKYGIYVDIVPYMLTPSAGSAGLDPYASSSFAWQGLPMMSWDTAGQNFLNAAGYGSNEKGFWQWFWTDMANNLKDYPNAIFEAWNEPGWQGGDMEPIPAGYMNYLQTMHDSIRATGSNNLIMMQWHMGWTPNGWGATLGWCKDINDAIHPTNIVYTTHFYYYAPSDLTAYWAKDYNGLKAQVQTGFSSMGVNAPLVINEEGSCTTSSPNKQNDYTWWQNLILVQRDLGIGAGAYYWLSDSGLGGVYSGESLLSSGYSPNTMGQSYINAYQPTSTVTPSPSPSPTPTATPTPTPSPTPSPTPTPTPSTEPTAPPTSNPTTTPTDPNGPNLPTDPSNPTTQPTPSPTPKPTNPPVYVIPRHYYHRWYEFTWSRFNVWFFYIR